MKDNLTFEFVSQIGFNRGNGTQWTGFDRFSGLSSAADIDDNSNSDVWGKGLTVVNINDGYYRYWRLSLNTAVVIGNGGCHDPQTALVS